MMPTVRSMISRVVAPLRRAVEGQYRPGPYRLNGGWLSHEAGQNLNWWQLGHNLSDGSRSALVQACLGAYSETIASLPGSHWRRRPDGGRDRIETSALARILRAPNHYQTHSDFMLNTVRDLYSTGNSYSLAVRNHRFEIDALHPMNPTMSAPMVAEGGEVFYSLAGNNVVDRMFNESPILVPERDVLHLRLHSSRRYPNPLIGESPLLAAESDIVAGNAMANQQLQLYLNQSRPSAVMSTDLTLDKDQVQQIRDRWNEQSKGLHAGGVPILTSGLKIMPWSVTPKDGQYAELAKLSAERIALSFRIPLQMLNLAVSPASSTEQLMAFWLASGLGFALDNVEEGLDRLFGLADQPTEYSEFDTSALLRTAQKDRIEALARAVQGGIMSPDEARAMEDLGTVPYGSEVRMQAQCVPLSAASGISSAPSAPAQPAAEPASVKNYRPDLQAMRVRGCRRSDRSAPLDGSEPRQVVRKTKFDALQPRTFVRKTKPNGLQRH